MFGDLGQSATTEDRAQLISEFLLFVGDARNALKSDLVSKDNAEVQQIHGPIEEHDVDESLLGELTDELL